jgi:transcriptional regulator with XRE-family HTH domain
MTKYERAIEELREWCRAKRGRQQKIAKALRVSKQLVNGWLSGRCRMSLEDHFRIQDVREEGIPKPKHDAARLAHMVKGTETSIEKGLKTFNEVMESFRLIKKNKYYTEQYRTFEEYCIYRWGINLKVQMKVLTDRESSYPMAP